MLSNLLKALLKFIQKWMLEELQGQYSGLRWHNTFLAYKLPMKSNLIKTKNKEQTFL